MSNLISPRLKVPPAGKRDWAKTTPAEFKDRDGWPIRIGAKVTRLRHGKRTTGIVTAMHRDWKDRAIVEFSVDGAGYVSRPEHLRVQYQKASS